ncbi:MULTISPECIES: hypothetical protein [unclassified Streptomyces]|uniref:VG15 protein n=1 Tax=unclassified Streptomyces TaxID=2593676 RepID=UPI00148A0E25|nr:MULTISPECIES: hypothetical protein [unclassified Streptomyces]
MALTRQFQQQVMRVAMLLARRLQTAALRADADNIDGWWERISPRIQQEILTGSSALARLGRQYLIEHARIEGVQVEPVEAEVPEEQIATALLVTGPVAFKRHITRTGSEEGARRVMATTLSGAGQRLVLAGARETVTRTVGERREYAGWRRVSDGDPCAFCAMLISRGAVYSQTTVDFQAHDHDGCFPEPLYRREPEPPEVRRLYEQWQQVTEQTQGQASVDAWRRFWNNRQTQTGG